MEINRVKTEQDWLKLPKNTLKDDFSLNDPNVPDSQGWIVVPQ